MPRKRIDHKFFYPHDPYQTNSAYVTHRVCVVFCGHLQEWHIASLCDSSSEFGLRAVDSVPSQRIRSSRTQDSASRYLCYAEEKKGLIFQLLTSVPVLCRRIARVRGWNMWSYSWFDSIDKRFIITDNGLPDFCHNYLKLEVALMIRQTLVIIFCLQ